MVESAYKPLQPAKRPGGKPPVAPRFRVLVHRHYVDHYNQMTEAVGLQQAQQFWDHVSSTPDVWPAVGTSCILRGKAGDPKLPGWSRTIHFEVSSMARVDYSYNKAYQTTPDGDPHPVVGIWAINLSSH